MTTLIVLTVFATVPLVWGWRKIKERFLLMKFLDGIGKLDACLKRLRNQLLHSESEQDFKESCEEFYTAWKQCNFFPEISISAPTTNKPIREKLFTLFNVLRREKFNKNRVVLSFNAGTSGEISFTFH